MGCQFKSKKDFLFLDNSETNLFKSMIFFATKIATTELAEFASLFEGDCGQIMPSDIAAFNR